MCQGEYAIIRKVDEIQAKLDYLKPRLESWDYSKPVCLTIKMYRNPRTLSQNKLFHKWCTELSDRYIEKHPTYTQDAFKLYLKKLFLGLEDIKVGKEVITGQVRHTSALDKGEMAYFMEQCYHWARDQGIFLTVPQESEFAKHINQ